MPTNGETVYRTYAELQTDKWNEVVARIQDEADADYNNEVDRAKAKQKALNDLIKTVEGQAAKTRAATARIQPGDLTEAKRVYQNSLKEQSVTQRGEAAARGANAARLLKAKDMALKELRANDTVVAASGTVASAIGIDPVTKSIDDESKQALAIAQQMDAAGVTSKLRTGSPLAQLDQAVTFRDQLVQSGIKPHVADEALAVKGWEPGSLTRENVARQYDADAAVIEAQSHGGGIGEIRQTADEQVALSTATKKRIDDLEQKVTEAKAYVLSPEYSRLSSMTEDELLAEKPEAVSAFMKHRATILSNMDLFRSELNDPAISGGTTSRLMELRAKAQEVEADLPKRKTQMEILREAKGQFEPVYGRGGIRQAIGDTLTQNMPSVGPGSYDDKVAANDAKVFALNWKAAQELAKKPIVVDPADRSTGYLLFDTSKGALTPKQLVDKAKEASGGDPEKLNTIVLAYMKKKLAKSQVAQDAIKAPSPEEAGGFGTPKYVKPQTPYDQTAAEGNAPGAYENTAAGEGPYRSPPLKTGANGTNQVEAIVDMNMDESSAPMTKRDKLKLFLLKARDKGNAREIKQLSGFKE